MFESPVIANFGFKLCFSKSTYKISPASKVHSTSLKTHTNLDIASYVNVVESYLNLLKYSLNYFS